MNKSEYLCNDLEILEKAKTKGVNIVLPDDTLCGNDFSNDSDTLLVKRGQIPAGWEGMDRLSQIEAQSSR